MAKADAETLIQHVNNLIADEKVRIAVDLSELTYMNSTGLNILLSIFTATRNSGGELLIGSVSKKVEQLLVMTKLNSIFKIYDTMDEALLALSK